MTEPLSLNRRTLDQRAKKVLESLDADPDPQYLYLLQLAQWKLEGDRKEELPGARERENAHHLEEFLHQAIK